MPVLQEHNPTVAPRAGGGSPHRPVLLATLAVRVDPEAERMAIETALEAGVPLIVANVIWPPPSPTRSIRLQEDLEAVRATAARATERGLRTELLTRVTCLPPARSLLRLARAHDAGLVVFGPDRRHTRRRSFRRAAQAVCDGLDCLVWTAAAE